MKSRSADSNQAELIMQPISCSRERERSINTKWDGTKCNQQIGTTNCCHSGLPTVEDREKRIEGWCPFSLQFTVYTHKQAIVFVFHKSATTPFGIWSAWFSFLAWHHIEFPTHVVMIVCCQLRTLGQLYSWLDKNMVEWFFVLSSKGLADSAGRGNRSQRPRNTLYL